MNVRTSRITKAVAVVAALGFVAAACGDDEEADDAATATTTAAATEGTEAAEPAEGTEAGAEADSEASEFDLEGREITIAVENAYLPFNYINGETGEAEGWDYDAIGAMCEILNCVPVYQTFAWEPMIQAVADGQFDMAADGITITEDRKEIVDFSDGYIAIEQRMLVGIDSEIETLEDAKAADCPVVSQTGTTNIEVARENFGDDRVVALEEFGFVVQSILSGDNCIAIIDETSGQGYVGENAEDLKLVGESLSSDELGFVFPKGSDLVEPFNYALSQMKADGSLDAISAKFFGDSFTITYDDIGDTPATVAITPTTAAG